MTERRAWWRPKKDDDAPLNCQEVGRVLQTYLDAELDDMNAAKVSAHLEDCRLCGLEAGTYQRIKASLAEPTTDEVDPAAIERLRSFGAELSGDPTD